MKSNEEYVNIDEGVFKGVSYKINNTDFKDVDGKSYLIFDYNVQNLTPGMEKEFERFLGEFLHHLLRLSMHEDLPNNKDNI